MIPTVKMLCLPDDLGEERLLEIHNEIVGILTAFSDITGVEDERGALNLFQSDLMTYGLGSEIKIEISDLPMCTKETRDLIAQNVGEVFQRRFPGARIFCKAECCNPEAGVWSSH